MEVEMNAPKRVDYWFDTVAAALSSCFAWLPPGTGHFRLTAGGVPFTYNSIPGDHFQVEWGTGYTMVSFLPGRMRRPEHFVSLQTRVNQKIWALSLDGLLRRDPLLRPDNTPNFPVLTQRWDTSGHWTEVSIDLTATEFVAWKSTGHHSTAGQHAAHFPDQVARAAEHVREVMHQLNAEALRHGRRYAEPEAIREMEQDLRSFARIDPAIAAEMVINASLILPFCEAVQQSRQSGRRLGRRPAAAANPVPSTFH
jgi:hypothetical protein